VAGERVGRSVALVGVAALTLGLWLVPANASAYIDPGTGSLVVQAVVAALVTVGFLARSFWSRLVGVFRRGKPAPAPEDGAGGKEPS
jgi:ABC-type thiamin/hydroxymethylpyrimidine transport system permease subunit